MKTIVLVVLLTLFAVPTTLPVRSTFAYGKEDRKPNCPIGEPFLKRDCFPVEFLDAELFILGSGTDNVTMTWNQIKTARSYVLEILEYGQWKILKQFNARTFSFQHRIGCSQMRSYRLYAKDGAYRSRYSRVVSLSSFSCKN